MEAATEREKREHRKLSWHTWHGAALGRAERPPDLHDFMGVEAPKQSGADIDAAMQAFAAAFQRKTQS